MEGALELDEEVRAAATRGERTPHDSFQATRFRQPALNEGKLKPALYRKGKPMLPDEVHGPRPENILRHSLGGSAHGLTPRSTGGADDSADLESHGTTSPIHARTLAPRFLTPVVSPAPPGPAEASLGEDLIDDEYDAEDGDKDLEVAVNDLLQDENTRHAVNVVSEQISAIRRSTLIGVNATERQYSEDSTDEPAVKLHTFTNRDLEGSGSDREDAQVG